MAVTVGCSGTADFHANRGNSRKSGFPILYCRLKAGSRPDELPFRRRFFGAEFVPMVAKNVCDSKPIGFLRSIRTGSRNRFG